jgi:hypothetical protein
MDYKLFKNALTQQECASFIALGENQYPSLNSDQLYPNRGYPGFTLKYNQEALEKLSIFVDQSEFNITYDFEKGTGINFIDAQSGESLGQHFDKPLYEYDENMKVLPGFDNRSCSATVLACIGGTNIINVEGDDITMSPGDVIIMKGFTVHEMKPVVSDTFYLLSAFYCMDN